MSDDNALQPEAPVTGQGRMDAAWGANSGDETTADITRAHPPRRAAKFLSNTTPLGRVHSTPVG